MISRVRRRRLKAVLFDKDGTLLDFHATWSPILRDLAFDLAHGDEIEAGRLLDIGGYDAATGRIISGSVLAAGNTMDLVALWYPHASGIRRDALVQRIDARFCEGVVAGSVPVPGLVGTLDTLAAAGLVLGIATSDSTSTARAGINALGLDDRFTSILGYDAVLNPKPAPDLVWEFCRAASIGPSEVAVVGDSLHDLSMARSAGAGAAIGVLGGTSGMDDLASLADAVIDTLAHLPGWLGIDAPQGRDPVDGCTREVSDRADSG
jgi:phosphoglycolate phosphatase